MPTVISPRTLALIFFPGLGFVDFKFEIIRHPEI
jgi:hypothetical protein